MTCVPGNHTCCHYYTIIFFCDKVTFPLFCVWSGPGWRVYISLRRMLLDIGTKFEIHESFLEYVIEIIFIILFYKLFTWELSLTDNFYSLTDLSLHVCTITLVYASSKGTFTRVYSALCLTPTPQKWEIIAELQDLVILVQSFIQMIRISSSKKVFYFPVYFSLSYFTGRAVKKCVSVRVSEN